MVSHEEKNSEKGGRWLTLSTLRTTNRLERGKCYEPTFMRPAEPPRNQEGHARRKAASLPRGKAAPNHVTSRKGNMVLQALHVASATGATCNETLPHLADTSIIYTPNMAASIAM